MLNKGQSTDPPMKLRERIDFVSIFSRILYNLFSNRPLDHRLLRLWSSFICVGLVHSPTEAIIHAFISRVNVFGILTAEILVRNLLTAFPSSTHVLSATSWVLVRYGWVYGCCFAFERDRSSDRYFPHLRSGLHKSPSDYNQVSGSRSRWRLALAHMGR